MLYNNTFTKLAFFLLTGNALASVAPKVTVANGVNVHTSNGATRLPVIPSALAHHDDGWFPTKENLIFNKTVVEGDPAGFYFGWTFPGPIDAEPFFDGFSKNITMFLTPPGGVEEFIIGLEFGPGTNQDFCGVIPSLGFFAVFDADVVGTYEGRWNVEFGESSNPDAPVDPDTGCGPEPFDLRTVVFKRKWQVVAAKGY